MSGYRAIDEWQQCYSVELIMVIQKASVDKNNRSINRLKKKKKRNLSRRFKEYASIKQSFTSWSFFGSSPVHFSSRKGPPIETRCTWLKSRAASKNHECCRISPRTKLPATRTLAALGAPNSTSDLTQRHWGMRFYPHEKLPPFVWQHM